MAVRVPSLLGPVFYFDLVRTTRKGLHVWHRCLYAAALLSVLFLLYSRWFAHWEATALPAADLARFAGSFFATFLGVQFGAVILLTPAYVAGAVAEEKERRTLEYLLTTDLRNREIVLGKLFARLGNLALLLLTGLPVLSLMQFLGGVDPNLVLAGFLATGLTMLSLGSLSLPVSVHESTPLRATLATYFWAVLATLVTSCCPMLNWANPLAALFLMGEILDSDLLALFILVYTGGHALVAFVCCTLAIRHLRRHALGEPAAAPGPTVSRTSRPPDKPVPVARVATPSARDLLPDRVLPPVGDRALLWKEVYVEHGFWLERMNPFFSMVLIMAGLVVGYVAVLSLFAIVTTSLSQMATLGEPMNVWVRALGTSLGSLMLLSLAFSAAATVSRERERHTLDSLFTLPLDRRDILTAKWLGCLLSVRRLGVALGSIWAIGLLTTGLHVLALPLLAAAGFVYADFVISQGMYLSITCRTTLRATVWTVLTVLVVSLGPVLVGVEFWSPPVSLAVLAFGYHDFLDESGMVTAKTLVKVLIGLGFYAVAARLAWRAARKQFQQV